MDTIFMNSKNQPNQSSKFKTKNWVELNGES